MYKSFFYASRIGVMCTLGLLADTISASNQDTLTIMNSVEEINVVARVQQPTDNHTHLTGQELNAANTGQNLPYLLQQTPSLVVTSDDGLGVGYTYFRVRGTDHTRINMTVNDVPLNDSESQTVFWVNMTDMASSLSSIDVQRGVGPSTNGSSAFGASINMSTAPSDSPHRGRESAADERDAMNDVSTPDVAQVQVAFNGGMYNTFREMVSARVELPKNWYVAGRYSKVNSDGYLERATSDLYSYFGAVGYNGKRTKVDLTAFGGKEKTYMAWDGIDKEILERNPRYNPAGEYTDDEGKTAYYDNQTDNYKQQHVQLHLSQKLFPERRNNITSLRLEATLHYTHGAGYYEQYRVGKSFASFGLPDYVDEEENVIKETDFVRQKHLRNHFYGGVVALRYMSEPVDVQVGGAVNNYNGQHFGNLIYCRIPDYDLPEGYEFYRNRGDKLDANVYAKANWRVLNRGRECLSLYGDLQYRYVDYQINGINDEDLQPIPVHETFHFFNPKAGLTYVNGGHQTYAQFAIANREPSRKNYTEAGVNDIPLPERLYDYELGYTYAHRLFSVGANVYFMDYENQLVLTGKYSDTGAYLTRNVQNSYRTGVEITMTAPLLPPKAPSDSPRRGRGGAADEGDGQKRLGDVPIARLYSGVSLEWMGSLTLSRNRILDYTDWVDLYDMDWNWMGQEEVQFGNVDIAFSPSFTAHSVFTLKYAGMTAMLQTNVVGKQYLDNTMSEEASLPAYSTTNLHLEYMLPLPQRWPHIVLRCQVNNMFDAHYASNGGNWMCMFTDGSRYYTPWYYAQAGINVHAGFVVRM